MPERPSLAFFSVIELPGQLQLDLRRESLVKFLGFLFILAIKLRKSPFDLSTGQHAHQELVQGLNSDLSGFLPKASPSASIVQLQFYCIPVFPQIIMLAAH